MRIIRNTLLISFIISAIIHGFVFVVGFRINGNNSISDNNTKSFAVIEIMDNKEKKDKNIGRENTLIEKKINKQNMEIEKKDGDNKEENNDSGDLNNQITKPVPLDDIKIEYPLKAKILGIEGEVIIEITIDTEGNVKEYYIVKDLGFGCRDAVIEKIKKVKFKPSFLNGRPIESKLTLKFDFKILKN